MTAGNSCDGSLAAESMNPSLDLLFPLRWETSVPEPAPLRFAREPLVPPKANPG